jgi:hypothetical protein
MIDHPASHHVRHWAFWTDPYFLWVASHHWTVLTIWIMLSPFWNGDTCAQRVQSYLKSAHISALIRFGIGHNKFRV